MRVQVCGAGGGQRLWAEASRLVGAPRVGWGWGRVEWNGMEWGAGGMGWGGLGCGGVGVGVGWDGVGWGGVGGGVRTW